MATESGQGARRVFFALWPDEAVAAQLFQTGAAAHAGCGGRRMRRETLHLTLAFIGAVAPERVEVLAGIGAAIRQPCFSFTLDRLRCVPRKHIVWAASATPPPALAQLAAELHECLAAADFPIEVRPFAAHVTLLRNARCDAAPPQAPCIEWPVRDIVLVQSQADAAGAAYRIIGRWALA